MKTIIAIIIGVLTSFIANYLYDQFKKKRSKIRGETKSYIKNRKKRRFKNLKEKTWFLFFLLFNGVILYFVITGSVIIYVSDISDFNTFRKYMISPYSLVGALTVMFWIFAPMYRFVETKFFRALIYFILLITSLICGSFIVDSLKIRNLLLNIILLGTIMGISFLLCLFIDSLFEEKEST